MHSSLFPRQTPLGLDRIVQCRQPKKMSVVHGKGQLLVSHLGRVSFRGVYKERGCIDFFLLILLFSCFM